MLSRIKRGAVLRTALHLLAVLALTTLISGCQSSMTLDDPIASLRCLGYSDDVSMTRKQLDYIRARSDIGDVTCKTWLAGMYANGSGVDQDIPKAKALYLELAGVSEQAYYFLGDIAESGADGPPDYVKARQFYRRAMVGKGSARAETRLARLMEDGKGGPQDLEGALALYLYATKSSEEAWDGIQRVRARGVTLTDEQVQRYNQLWVGGTKGRLKRKMWRVQDKLAETFKPRPAGNETTVKIEYLQGSIVPRLSIVSSSGDSALDQAVLQELADFRFKDGPILPQGRDTWTALADVSVGSRR